jgi:hypothetical protein
MYTAQKKKFIRHLKFDIFRYRIYVKTNWMDALVAGAGPVCFHFRWWILVLKAELKQKVRFSKADC